MLRGDIASLTTGGAISISASMEKAWNDQDGEIEFPVSNVIETTAAGQLTSDAVVKAADLQEPTEMILEMVERWKKGFNVVLAVRKGREERKSQTLFANLYYFLVRRTALPSMPKGGFDVYLLDRKVIEVLMRLDEKNSALTGQILWSGFRTDKVYYTRLIMLTLGILGEYLWRTFDASRNRPPYIIEDENEIEG